jgi:Helix-turn-helix domain
MPIMNTTAVRYPLAVDIIEARRLLGVGRDVMNDLIASGEIRSFKVGSGGPTSRRMIPVRELQDWLDRQIGREPQSLREELHDFLAQLMVSAA